MSIDSTSPISGAATARPASSSWTIDLGPEASPSAAPCSDAFARTLASTSGTEAPTGDTGSGTSESPAARTLAVWLEDEQRLQVAIDRALDGSASSPQDLIRLQVLVAGASLRVETATRVVDRCVQSLKQLTQQQI